MAVDPTQCGPSSTSSGVDFSVDPRCGRRFLERIGAIPSSVGPLPQFSPHMLRSRTVPLFPPLPPAELQDFLTGDPVSDRGQTLGWPHPDLSSPPT